RNDTTGPSGLSKGAMVPKVIERYYDVIQSRLRDAGFRARALFARFGIEVLATTDSPLDDLRYHRALRESTWTGRVIPTFRPDSVVDPQHESFVNNLIDLSKLTGRSTTIHAPCSRSPRAMMPRAVSIAGFWPDSSRNISSRRPMRPTLRSSSPTGSSSRPTDCNAPASAARSSRTQAVLDGGRQCP